jgi:uncharacterized membrane protein
MLMTRTTNSIDVNVPVRTAYNQWTQFESFPRFMEGVESVQQLGDKRLHWKAKVGGKTQEWDAEITEQLPDQKIAWRSLSGDTNAGVVTFNHKDDATTTILLTLDYEPQGVVESAGAALGFMDRQVQGDLKRFKAFVEGRGAETGGWRGTIEDHPELGAR